jgi:uncharacterized membrane protein
MSNKILISLFAVIILIFVFEGVKALDKIDSSFIKVVESQAENIENIDEVFNELERFKEFLYFMNGAVVMIILPALINRKSV